MGTLCNVVACYVLTDREPWSLYVVQISVCAPILLHVLYVMNAHQAFWICNFANTHMHAQIEDNI